MHENVHTSALYTLYIPFPHSQQLCMQEYITNEQRLVQFYSFYPYILHLHKQFTNNN